MKILPSVTCSRPANIRSNVDFPHPDGPTSTMNAPSWIVRLTASTALTPFGYTFAAPSRLTPPTRHLSVCSYRRGQDREAAVSLSIRGRVLAGRGGEELDARKRLVEPFLVGVDPHGVERHQERARSGLEACLRRHSVGQTRRDLVAQELGARPAQHAAEQHERVRTAGEADGSRAGGRHAAEGRALLDDDSARGRIAARRLTEDGRGKERRLEPRATSAACERVQYLLDRRRVEQLERSRGERRRRRNRKLGGVDRVERCRTDRPPAGV